MLALLKSVPMSCYPLPQVRKIARTSTSVLAPLASVFGGIVGQEVAKAVRTVPPSPP